MYLLTGRYTDWVCSIAVPRRHTYMTMKMSVAMRTVK